MSLENYTYEELYAEINRRDREKQEQYLATKAAKTRPMALDVYTRLQAKKDLLAEQAQRETLARQSTPVDKTPMTPAESRQKLQQITGVDFSKPPSGNRRQSESSAEEMLSQLNANISRLSRKLDGS